MAKILAVVPARGGSKRVPRKNLLPLHGRPLLEWTVSFAAGSGLFDVVAISSDDSEIIDCSTKAGAVSFGHRPKDLSSDHASSVDVALHELQCAEAINGEFDYLALLQPTTPYRNPNRFRDAIALLDEHPDVPSVIGVSPVKAAPFHMFTMEEDQSISPLFPDHLKSRTQDLPKTVEVNGALYLVRTKALKMNKSFYFSSSKAVLCHDPKENVDIDTFDDFAAAERLLKETLSV